MTSCQQQPMTSRKYCCNKGMQCPYCQSNNISSTDNLKGAETNNPTITVTCHNCSESWSETWKRTGWKPLQTQEVA